jgi:hypothetical protein
MGTPIDNTNPKAIIEAIKSVRNGLSPSKKQALSAEFTKAGLPKQPTEDTTVDVLLKMLEVAKKLG